MQVKIAPAKILEYQINMDGGYTEVQATIDKELYDRDLANRAERNLIQIELGKVYHEMIEAK